VRVMKNGVESKVVRKCIRTVEAKATWEDLHSSHITPFQILSERDSSKAVQSTIVPEQ
jgi:hypothetical protein